MNENKGQSGSSQGSSTGQSGQIDARYNEDAHVIGERLTTAMEGRAGSRFVVLGEKPDGSPFLWASGDKRQTEELTKQFAPELAGLNA